jgi:ectoine hydroxylase
MELTALRHCLTEAERAEFDARGILVIRDALAPADVERLREGTERIYSRALAKNGERPGRFEKTGILADDPAFLELIDHPTTLPKVWGILGWNIFLYFSNLAVSQRVDRPQPERTFFFHQDSGQVNRDLETHPRPRLSLKVIYYLSDLTEEGRGNTWVIPGSHLRDELEMPRDGTSQPAGAEPVLCEPGSALLLDRRTWHASSPNWASNDARVALFYGYAFRWITAKGPRTMPPSLEDCDPTRRQLLGLWDDPNSPYEPGEDGPPLRVWLEQHAADTDDLLVAR